MRGNHIIWGRAEPPISDATSTEERGIIARCVVTQTAGRKTWFDVSLDGEPLGKVRTKAGAMEYWPINGEGPLYAGSEWSPSDPPHALAILALLSLHNV